jgi:DNA-binding NtrC family response regulator
MQRTNPESVHSLKTMLDNFERRVIESMLAAHRGNQRRAAQALGVLPTTLHEKMKRLGLRPSREGDGSDAPTVG